MATKQSRLQPRLLSKAINMEDPLIAPRIIDFIWMGGPIPEKYLDNILKLANASKKKSFVLEEKDKQLKDFIVRIWTDNPAYILNPLKRKFSGVTVLDSSQLTRTFNVDIESIDTFLVNLKKSTDPFWQEKQDVNILSTNGDVVSIKKKTRAEFLDLCMNYERFGEKNYAVASDLLRYALKYEFGGYYFDCDILFNLTRATVLTPDSLPLGFKLLVYEEEQEFIISFNDVLCSLPKHLFFSMLVDDTLNEYNRLASQYLTDREYQLANINTMFFKPTCGDMRRAVSKHQIRENIVLQSTGPGAVIKTLKRFLEKSGCDVFYEDFYNSISKELKDKLFFPFEKFDEENEIVIINAAGMVIDRRSNFSWSGGSNIESHDDTHLPVLSQKNFTHEIIAGF